MAIRVLLVALDELTKASHEKLIREFGIDFDSVISHKQVLPTTALTHYNGILIDNSLYESTDSDIRGIVREIMKVYPVLRIRNDNQWMSDWSYFNKVEIFLTRSCNAFQARPLRSDERIPCTLNILLSNDIIFTQSRLMPTVTVNISEGGCFIVYLQPWKYKDTIHFTVKELADDHPIVAQIRWRVEWGMAMRLPGLGVLFKQITPSQVDRLMSIAKSNPGS